MLGKAWISNSHAFFLNKPQARQRSSTTATIQRLKWRTMGL